MPRTSTASPRGGTGVALFALGAAFSIALAMPPSRDDRPAGEEDRKVDPELVRSLESIRDGFRSRRAELISPLLPSGGKVFLGVKVITSEAGFYSRDQVDALLRQVFGALHTLQFHINLNLPPRGSEGGASVIICPAAWSFLDRGVRSDLSLRFLLARQNGRWTVSEIREAR
jgi:hypothetical protein